MDHRIRIALGMGPSPKFTVEIEADETLIGGKARNMHLRKNGRGESLARAAKTSPQSWGFLSTAEKLALP